MHDGTVNEHTCYAHSAQGQPVATWHKLEDHLNAVANRAEEFASVCLPPGWARIAGALHDAGKFSKAFQERLQILAATELPAHLEDATPQHVDHSTAGAQHAAQTLGDAGRLIAYAIAGHHAGLPDGISTEESCLQRRLQKMIEDWSACPEEFNHQSFALERPPVHTGFQLAFFTRMLFSCLVDADFLDTEAFCTPAETAARSGAPALPELLQRLNRHLAHFHADTDLNHIRAQVLDQCRTAAANPQGFFSLTVPTGGGKTLSSMAFALEHAIKHNLQRVIYVIPYTSIIEQNADVFRKAIGDDAVLEHHSNFDPEKENTWSRLAAQNWDAPLIVTTNVQFFESLFAAKPSACRKLHNIARSVVILDEAQMLPPDVLRPCLEALRELVRAYRTTVVLCTATQPALSATQGFKDGLEGVTEIIASPQTLYHALKRVQTHRCDTLNLDELAERLSQHEQVLCILNTRTHARELTQRIPHAVHLSALMCPEHRSKVLDKIRSALANHQPCCVISTQLVEAGVDIDFPVVYRALAGIDSIAQAAGRCNREGKRPHGDLYLFQLADTRLRGHLLHAAQEAQLVLNRHDDPLTLEAVEEFFRALFWVKGDALDKQRILQQLSEGNQGWIPFRTVAGRFKVIEDAMQPVVISWNDTARTLIEEARFATSLAGCARKLQRFTVQVYPNQWHALRNAGALELIHDYFPVLASHNLYDHRFGLCPLNDFTPPPAALVH